MSRKRQRASAAEAIQGKATAEADAGIRSGLALHRQARLAEAKAIYESVVARFPGHFDALNLLATIALQTGDYVSAIDLFEKAISANPGVGTTYNNRGAALQELGRYEEALASYEEALALQPGYAEAHFNRGITLQALNRQEDALASYDEALALKPDYPKAHYNRGIALQQLGRPNQSLASYDRALTLQADYAEAWYNRGTVLQALRLLDEALASYDRALALKPDCAEAHVNRGNALKDLRQLDEALASYDRALVLKPDYAEAHVNRGSALKDLKRLDEALASYDKALSLKPDFGFLFGNCIDTRMRLCDWASFSEDIAKYEAGIAADKRVTAPHVALALIDSPELHLATSRIFAEALYPRRHAADQVMAPNTNGKIRVGYFSADFHNHATAYLLAELFEAHDSSRFEIYGFSFGSDKNDDMRKRLSSAFHRFIDVNRIGDKEAARISRELAIDIAVDLKGYTRDARTGIFAEGAAPIQVNYLGYPGSMGVDYFDYIIADKTVIPEESRSLYAEQVAYLPHSYQANDSKRKIADRAFTKQELGLPETGFVFCCFNGNYKVHPATFDRWMRILRATDGSVLWLLEGHPTAARNLRKEAESRGIDGARMVFAKHMPLDEHLARHRLADLFLDTLPCNAHTTASDALWAGLPLLTCMGRSFASRVAASLLNALDIPELITRSSEEYEARAIELASNRDRLVEIKDKLDRNRKTAPLFNGRTFALHIEAAYQAMYDRYRSGLPNATIEVIPYPGRL